MVLDKFRGQPLVWDKANKLFHEKIVANGSDANGRKLVVQVVNDGVVENLTGSTLSLSWKKGNNDGLDGFKAVDASKGLFELYYPTGLLSNVGRMDQANLYLVDSTGATTSRSFEFVVEKGINKAAAESSDSFTALDNALGLVGNINGKADKTELNALKSTTEQSLFSVNQQLAEKADTKDMTLLLGKISEGTPLFSENVSGMTDIKRNYVNTTDGFIYAHNGTAFISTGVRHIGTGISDREITDNKYAKRSVLPDAISNYPLGNLMEAGTFHNNKYVDATGTLIENSLFRTVSKVEVFAGERIEFYAGDSASGISNFALSMYDINNQYLGYAGSKAGPKKLIDLPTVDANIAIPEGVKYADFTYAKNKDAIVYFRTGASVTKKKISWLSVTEDNLEAELRDKINRVVAKWAGKKANFLGDSITFGHGLASISTQRFSYLVCQSLGMIENNYGVSSTRIATVGGATNSFVKRYPAMDTEAAVTFVMGSTNDYGHTMANSSVHVPFGTFQDRVDGTFYGGLHVLYKGLAEMFIGKKVVVVTPPHRSGVAGGTDDDPHPQTGKRFVDYINAIKEVAQYYGLEVLDLYSILPFNVSIVGVPQRYIPDKLHPNVTGHAEIANETIRYMNNL